MIIDCDTGIDDALAIAYILSNPDIDLIGVVATFGNTYLKDCIRNSIGILENFDRYDVKVYAGSSHGLNEGSFEKHTGSDPVHGKNGIGDVDLGENKGSVQDVSGIDFIVDSARKYGQDLHLVFVGPLTDLYKCIEKDEEALCEVGKITIMGGALTVQGNRDIYSEANIASDPLAAKKVFSSKLKIDVIPLDVTLKTLFRVKDIAHWNSSNKAGKNIYEIARFYYEGEYGDEQIGGAMHDPLAAFASYDPSIITNWFPCNLTAEDSGRTICTFEELNLKEKRHRVALDVDGKRFTDTYIDMVSKLIEKCGL